MIRRRGFELAVAAYAYAVTVGCSTAFIARGRAGDGLEVDVATILLWQAARYALWIPVGIAAVAIFERWHLTRAALTRVAALGLSAVPLTALAATWLDRRYALGGGGADAIDAFALRLPIDILIFTAIAAAAAALAARRSNRDLAEALGAARAWARQSAGAGSIDRLTVSVGNARHLVATDAIESIGAAGNYVVVHWGGREGLMRGTLKAVEATLDPGLFLRIHRATIVGLAKVVRAASLSDGSWRLTMESGEELIASRTYRDEVLARMGVRRGTRKPD